MNARPEASQVRCWFWEVGKGMGKWASGILIHSMKHYSTAVSCEAVVSLRLAIRAEAWLSLHLIQKWTKKQLLLYSIRSKGANGLLDNKWLVCLLEPQDKLVFWLPLSPKVRLLHEITLSHQWGHSSAQIWFFRFYFIIIKYIFSFSPQNWKCGGNVS